MSKLFTPSVRALMEIRSAPSFAYWVRLFSLMPPESSILWSWRLSFGRVFLIWAGVKLSSMMVNGFLWAEASRACCSVSTSISMKATFVRCFSALTRASFIVMLARWFSLMRIAWLRSMRCGNPPLIITAFLSR